MRNGTISGRIVGRPAVVGFMTKNSRMIQSAGSLVCYIHVTVAHLRVFIVICV